MSGPKRRVVVWTSPDGKRSVAAIGFSVEDDAEDLRRLREWATSTDVLLAIDADVTFEVISPRGPAT